MKSAWTVSILLFAQIVTANPIAHLENQDLAGQYNLDGQEGDFNCRVFFLSSGDGSVLIPLNSLVGSAVDFKFNFNGAKLRQKNGLSHFTRKLKNINLFGSEGETFAIRHELTVSDSSLTLFQTHSCMDNEKVTEHKTTVTCSMETN